MMDNSLKIGILAGIVAGIISSITSTIYTIILLNSNGFNLGMSYWDIPPPPITPISLIFTVELVYSLIFGIILGIIFSKVYGVIPGNNIVKAMIFALFMYAMVNLRFATAMAIYGYVGYTLGWIFSGLANWIPFGITFGIVYQFLRGRYTLPEEPKIITYDMKEAFIPAAIAGLLGGMTTFGTILVGLQVGIWHWIPEQLADVGFLIGQFGGQTMFHLIWCTIFGLFYPKVYNLVPGKGVIKGLYYGLIGLLLTEGAAIGYPIVYGYYFEVPPAFFWAAQMILLGTTVWIVFGIVLGYLYRKPGD